MQVKKAAARFHTRQGQQCALWYWRKGHKRASEKNTACSALAVRVSVLLNPAPGLLSETCRFSVAPSQNPKLIPFQGAGGSSQAGSAGIPGPLAQAMNFDKSYWSTSLSGLPLGVSSVTSKQWQIAGLNASKGSPEPV